MTGDTPRRLAKALLATAAGLGAGVTLAIFVFMLVMGIDIFRTGHPLSLLHQTWAPARGIYGVLPMLAGSSAIAGLALLLAFPLSLGCTAFICLFAPPTIGGLMRRLIYLLTGVPTVIYGFVGLFVLVPLVRQLFAHGSGFCILSAALLLALLICPTMIMFFTSALEGVPQSFLMAADALGATAVQKFVFVMLPNAWRGIMAGTLMGLGRAVGDTMIALMVAGNAVALPSSVLDPARTLTSHIALVMAAEFESPEFKSIFVCGLVLYGFTFGSVLIVRRLKPGDRRYKP